MEYPVNGGHFTDQSEISHYADLYDAFVVAIAGRHGQRRCEIADLLKSEYALLPFLMLHFNSFL